MQNRILDEHIFEVKKSSNAAYLFRRADMFYDIGFRVVKNQKGGTLLECHRLRYNGDIKVVYFTNEFMPLSQILEESNIDVISIVIRNLMNAIEAVENNGFLNIACTDNKLDKIFVDRNTMSIKLIYLPLNIPVNGAATSEFKSELRAQLIKALQATHLSEEHQIKNIVDILSDGTITLSEIGKRIQILSNVSNGEENKRIVSHQINTPGGEYNDTIYTLSAVNGLINIPITKNEFLVGKSIDKVDGVISSNSAISRTHCKFMIKDGKLFIKDMNSANGTYVLGKRISSEAYVEVQEGTRIRLANMDFLIRR